jgi:hypothetical protein
MDDVKPKGFRAELDGESKQVEPSELSSDISTEMPPKRRKTKHKKFIDLQKLPPKPKPLLEE